MQSLTEITKVGDPMMRVRIPKAIQRAILEAAKVNKRRPQDELIKRIFLSFKSDEQLQAVQNKILPQLKTIYQV